jgi:hypothetical protein
LGLTEPSKTWFFAEGSTREGFDSWLLLQNPGRSAAKVNLTLLPEGGESVRHSVTVGGGSRAAVRARDLLDGRRFGARLESDQPIVAERATYFGGESDGRGTGAHASPGSPRAAKSWYLPEGSTRPPHDEQLAVANPGDSPARVRVDFSRTDGGVTGREYSVPAGRRLTISVNDELPDLVHSTHVSADQPIVVERTTYLSGGSGATSSLGISR